MTTTPLMKNAGGAPPLYSLNTQSVRTPARAQSKTTFAQGFTLIELLVVIAIIGILSAVVLASLSVARTKARDASVRTTLKNIVSEVEVRHEEFFTNPLAASFRYCESAGQPLNNFITSLVDAGFVGRCWVNYVTYGSDSFFRGWGVTAAIPSSSQLIAFSASGTGVVQWDQQDKVGTMNFGDARAACSAEGKRLPMAAEYQSLQRIYLSTLPPGFSSGGYWTNEDPFQPTGSLSVAHMPNSGIGWALPTQTFRVRCVH